MFLLTYRLRDQFEDEFDKEKQKLIDEKDENIEKLKNDLRQDLKKLEEDLKMKNDAEIEITREKYEREKELVSFLPQIVSFFLYSTFVIFTCINSTNIYIAYPC